MTVTASASEFAPAQARSGSGHALHVSVYRHIQEIDAGDWDCLLGPDDLQATHRFVKVCQDSGIEDAEYRHVLVRRGSVVEATASFCCFRVALDVLATGVTRNVLAAVRRLWPGALRIPVVFCGLPVSFGRSCLRFQAGVNRGEIIAALSNVAEQFASEMGAAVICFKEFDVVGSAALVPLVAHGYFRAPSLPGSRLALRWRTVDEFAAAMRASYRRQFLATRRARDRHQLAVRTVDDWRGVASRVHELYTQVINRAEFKLERLPPLFFERLADSMVESRAILIERSGTLIASAVILDGPAESTFLLVGMDYGVALDVEAYHVLVDEVVAHAIAAGASAIELGQTSYERKARLGAVPTSRELFLRCRAPAGHALLRLASGLLFPEVQVRARRVFRDAHR